MTQFKYTPDDDTDIHKENAIKLLCKFFQSHENGLPEWAKNSSDEYARRDAHEDHRVIVVLFRDGKKGLASSISCLDLSGMTSEVIEGYFRKWVDPEAAQQGGEANGVQGGHGNGGKCYMTQMFEDYSLIYTVKNGRKSVYGVQGGAIRFGYIPDRKTGRNVKSGKLEEELEEALAHTGYSVASLPAEARSALALSQGFTLVTGVNPRGYDGRLPVSRLVEGLAEHPQMLQTLQMCNVYVLTNGKLVKGGKPLSLPKIEPMKGAEAPRIIAVPEKLKDPSSNKKISTTKEGSLPVGEACLYTSKSNMRRSNKKARHSVIFTAESGYIGYVPVPELDIQSSYRDRIYGTCRLEALEDFKQNDRGRLAESPLTRAVERFLTREIQEYAKEFEYKDKREYDKKERNEISQINEALDQWKNRFLHDLMDGMWGDSGPGPGPEPLPVGVPKRLDLAVTKSKLGRGIATRPALRFFDKDGKRVRSVPVNWHSEDTNVAMVDDLGIINSFSYGSTVIYAETEDGLRSNRATLEVVQIHKIEISPNHVELGAGGRHKLDAICTLADGGTVSDVALIWTEDNTTIARVSSSGMVYGFQPGEISVTAADDSVEAKEPAKVTVVEGEGKGGKGDKKGKGFPRVLVSGEIDPDPETGEYVNFGIDDPPICQRVQDAERNVWWINSAAPMAKLYLDQSEGYGYKKREWRMYHLERYIDVIVQIAFMHAPGDVQSMTPDMWITSWGEQVVKIQGAIADQLSGFIADGELPEG